MKAVVGEEEVLGPSKVSKVFPGVGATYLLSLMFQGRGWERSLWEFLYPSLSGSFENGMDPFRDRPPSKTTLSSTGATSHI